MPANAAGGNPGVLGLVLSGYVLLWLLYPQQLLMSDPWAYSQLAHAMGNGTFLAENPDNIFVHRLGPTLTTALAYKLFGVSIWATNLAPLMAALLIITTIWFALPNLASRAMGAALCVTNVTFFDMSVNLYPDIISAAFMAVSTLLLVNREKYLVSRVAWIYPVFALVCLFMAFLAKLSAYWVIPVWLIVLIQDWRAGRSDLLRAFYLPAAVAGAVLGILYLAYNALAWGHPLARLLNVSEVVEAGLWALDGASAPVFRRLTSEVVAFLLNQYGVVLVPALLALPFVPRSMRVWGYYSVTTLLFFWFGSTSFTSYQPMPLVNRMLLPSLPGLCILAGYFATQVKFPKVGGQRILNPLLAITLVVMSAVPFHQYTAGWKYIRWYEGEVMRVLRSDMTAGKGRFLVVSLDNRSAESLKFFFAYRYPANLEMVTAADLGQRYSTQQIEAFDTLYIYQNRAMAQFLNRNYGQPLYDLSAFTQGAERLYDDGDIILDVLRLNGDAQVD